MSSHALDTDLTPLLPLRLKRAQQRRHLSILALALAWVSCGAASADCDVPGVEPRRARIQHQGQDGMWFHIEVARCLLRDVAKLPPTEARVTLLENRMVLRDDQYRLLREAVSLAERQATVATEALQRSDRLRLEAVNRLHAWWRSPWLWTGVGLVVGLGVVLLSVEIIEAT